MAPTYGRSITVAVFAAAVLILSPALPLKAQAPPVDSGHMRNLYRRYLEQGASHQPDSAFATLRAILADPTATAQDSTRVSRLAVTGGRAIARVVSSNHPYLDSLSLKALEEYVDTLRIAASYLTLADSVGTNVLTAFLLYETYFNRTLTREAIACRTNECAAWIAARDDALRLIEYSRRTRPTAAVQLLPPYTAGPPSPPTPASLLDYANSHVGARCQKDTASFKSRYASEKRSRSSTREKVAA